MLITAAQMSKAVQMVHESLDQLERDWPGVRRMMLDCRVGWPSGRSDGPRGSDVADPTGEAALVPDEAVAALRRVSEVMAWMVAVSNELDATRRRWKQYAEPPRPCANIGCPDRKPAAERRARCLACDRHKRLYGCERGTEPEVAAAS